MPLPWQLRRLTKGRASYPGGKDSPGALLVDRSKNLFQALPDNYRRNVPPPGAMPSRRGPSLPSLPTVHRDLQSVGPLTPAAEELMDEDIVGRKVRRCTRGALRGGGNRA